MLVLLATAICGHAQSHVLQRALWVWHTHELIDEQAAQQKFFDFLDAPKGDPKNRISVVFVSRLGIDNPASYGSIRSFVAKAHSKSIRVDYLCGDETYALPAKQNEGLWQLEYVLDYNRRAPKNCRFDGLQYDVEPYALPKWPAQSIIDGYLKFLDRAHQRIADSHQSVKLGAAIPRWFDGADLHGLYKSVIDRTDYVAVMDYVDNAQHFVADGANEVAYGTETGKQVWLGAETSELPDEPSATFFKQGNAAMEEAFNAATKAYWLSRGFAGVAVEYYEPYVSLKP